MVHTHVESFMHVALLRWMLPKFVFVHTIHNDALYESGGKVKAFFKRLFFQKGWCKAVTISRASDNSFKDFYHAPSTLIYNGRAPFIERESPGDSLTLIPAKESGYNFISIGHISKTKITCFYAKQFQILLKRELKLICICLVDLHPQKLWTRLNHWNVQIFIYWERFLILGYI